MTAQEERGGGRLLEWLRGLAPGRLKGYLVFWCLSLAAALILLHPGFHTEPEFVLERIPTDNYLDLFRPAVFGEVMAGEWVFNDLAVSSGTLRVSLRKGATKYWVVFAPPEQPRMVAGREYAGFIMVVAGTPPDPGAGFRESAQRLAENLEAATATHQLWRMTPLPSNLPRGAYQAGLLVLLAAAFGLAIRGLRRTGPPSRQTLLVGGALLALGALALAIRLWLSPQAPLHANGHGLEELDHLLFPLESPYPAYTGRGHSALADLTFAILPRRLWCFWLVTALVGCATCLAGALAVRALEDRRGSRSPWIAALLLALCPVAVRISTSESSFLLVGLFLPASVAGLAHYVRRPEPLSLVIGTAALFLLVHLHVVTAPFLLLPFLALILGRGRFWSRRHLLPYLLAVLTTLALALPHLRFIWNQDVQSHLGFLSYPFVERALGSANLFCNWKTNPVLVPLLALAGLVSLGLGRPRALLFVALCLPLFLPGFIIASSLSDMVRYQTPMVVFLTCVAGPGAAWLVSRHSSRWFRRAVAAALAALFFVTANQPMKTVLEPDSEAREFLFMQEAVHMLPQSGVLVVLGDRHRGKVTTYFPRTLLLDEEKHFTLVPVDRFLSHLDQEAGVDEPAFAFGGLAHHWLAAAVSAGGDEETSRHAPLLDDFARLRARYSTGQVAARTIVARKSPVADHPMDFNPLPASRVEIELLELGFPAGP